jgi:hypothetical protein
MKRSLLFVAVVSAAMSAQTSRLPFAVGQQNVTTINMPTDVRRAIADDLEYDEADPLKGVATDLNGDGVTDFLVQSAPSLCGNGGCVYVLIDGAARRKVGQFFGGPLYVRAERSRGYANVATYSHASAQTGTFTEYSFDGNSYVVTSKRTVEGPALERLTEALRQIPNWTPVP